MPNDTISVAAAVLATDFIRRDGLDQVEAVRLWRQLRARMKRVVAKEGAAAEEAGAALAVSVPAPAEAEEAPTPARSRRRAART